MQPSTLKAMVEKTIAENLDRYGDLLRIMISPPCRQQILETALVNLRFRHKFKSLSLKTMSPLFCSKTVEIKFGQLKLTGGQEQIEEFANCLVMYATNINHLEMPRLDSDGSNPITENAANAICKLQHLEHLNIGSLRISLTHFARIATECSALKYIKSQKVLIDTDLSVLNSCERFAYLRIGSLSSGDRLHITLETELPASIESHAALHRRLEILTSEPPKLKFLTGLSSLSHLYILPPVKRERFYCLLDLLAQQEDDTEGVCVEWKNRHYRQRLLQDFGANLEKLEYRDHSSRATVQYEDLFQLCPNLRSLFLDVNFLIGEAPVSALHQLREITLVQCSRSNQKSIALSSILRAPQLEKLVLDVDIFSISDREEVLKMLQTPNEGLLRNLKCLILRFMYYERNSERAHRIETMRAAFHSVIPNNCVLRVEDVDLYHGHIDRRNLSYLYDDLYLLD